MKLRGRKVDVAPDALRVARALADEPGFVFLWSASGGGPSYAACRPVDFATGLDPEPSLGLAPHSSALGACPRWVGLLPYESRRTLERPARTRRPDPRAEPHVVVPLWARFGAVARVDRDVVVVGDDAECIRRLAALLDGPAPAPERIAARVLDGEADAAHAARVERALELIFEGQIYQVNLARRFDLSLVGRPVDLVERLGVRARAPYAAAMSFGDLTVVGSSPELFLDLDARGRLLTSPIKGTRPRGRDAVEDREFTRELSHDLKERAELAMVIDVERNDLGRVAETGSVRVLGVPHVQSFGTVHHRLVSVSARLRRGVGRAALLESMLPSGSVTGAPKIRAMEVIAELESERRGLYTGALGALGYDGSLRLAMAIRTLTRRGDVAHYFAGGGIVADSRADKEVLETRWKAAQLAQLLQG